MNNYRQSPAWLNNFYQGTMLLIVSLILGKVWVLTENSIEQKKDIGYQEKQISSLKQENLYLRRLIEFYHNGGSKPQIMSLQLLIPGPLQYERRGHAVKANLHRRCTDETC